MRFLIRNQGALKGSYPHSTDEKACAACKEDADALDAYAVDSGHADFKALCAATGQTRDDFKAEAIQE